MFAVHETIDLGLMSLLANSKLDLLSINHPTLYSDPIHPDTLYVAHTFGVHGLYFEPLFISLAQTKGPLDTGTKVVPLLSTVSPDKQYVSGSS